MEAALLSVLCLQENGMIVYVEKKVLEDPAIESDDNFGPVKKKFCTFREGKAQLLDPLWLGLKSPVALMLCRLPVQITTTFPTRLTSSSAWVEMGPCCMPPRCSR